MLKIFDYVRRSKEEEEEEEDEANVRIVLDFPEIAFSKIGQGINQKEKREREREMAQKSAGNRGNGRLPG